MAGGSSQLRPMADARPSIQLKTPLVKGSGPVRQHLFNFDDAAFRSSRHVLTSPRSLRACANLGIKPVDLLPKSVKYLKSDPARSSLAHNEILDIHRQLEEERCTKLKIAREEYTRLLSLAEDGSGGRGDVPHHSLVRSRQDQGSSGRGKPARRVKSASACLHEQREGGLSKDERILRALLTRLQSQELQELSAAAAQQEWLKEREERAGQREAEAKRHQAEVVRKRQRDKLKMEKVHQAKMCHEVFMSEGRKVDARVTWQRWEEGARQQAQLREEVLSARRNKERQRRMAQKHRHSFTVALEEKARWRAQSHLQQVMEEAAAARATRESQSAIVKQVRSATERALFEARRREVEEERRVEAALLEKALELKDRAAAQRQALAAAARGQQTLIRERNVREQQIQSKLQQLEEAEEVWRRATEEQGRKMMAQAEVLAKQHTDMKRAKVREMRVLWANEHAANLARVQSEEDEKLAVTKEELEVKDRKSRELQCSRENAIRQSREQAQVSAQLRTQLKEKISQRSFDQMAREADARAALESRWSTTRPTPRVVIA